MTLEWRHHSVYVCLINNRCVSFLCLTFFLAFFPFGGKASDDEIIEQVIGGPINFTVQFLFYRSMEEKFYVSFN